VGLRKILEELYQEKEELEEAIALLEQLQRQGLEDQSAPAKDRSRRGRKSMDAEERRAVSARMKKYWDRQRNKSET
jgi:uncharacterized protein HemY